MIQPAVRITSSIHIRGAAGAVWQYFAQVTNWRLWRPTVLTSAWAQGEPWDEGARITMSCTGFFGVPYGVQGVVRMCVPADTAVWETAFFGTVAVTSVRLVDEVGGCRVTVREVYHGPTAPLISFMRRRQERAWEQALANMKNAIEGMPRR